MNQSGTMERKVKDREAKRFLSGILWRALICILFLGVCLYSYLNLQNEITDLRIQIPHLTSEVRRIEEENTHLLYEIEQFESPENLMHLAKQSEFAYLRYPMISDVVRLIQSDPVGNVENRGAPELRTKPTIRFATGATP